MKYLIIVDMQNDFIDGTLGTNEAKKIVPNVVKKIKEAVKEKKIIIATRDTHYNNYLQTLEGKKLPVKHCIIKTDGWQLNKDIEDALNKTTGFRLLMINKNTFGYTDWSEIIESEYLDNVFEHWEDKDFDNHDEFEICGLCTDICVVSNALILRALYPNALITINKNCCAGVTPETHKAALETMKMCQIDII